MSWAFPALVVLLFLAERTGLGREWPTRGVWLLTIVIGISAFLLWWTFNRVRRVTKGRVGVVVGLIADNDSHQRQVRDDFIRSLIDLIQTDSDSTILEVIELPDWQARECVDSESAHATLARVRGALILYGSVRIRLIEGKNSHLIKMQGLVRHAPTTREVSKALSSDLNSALPAQVFFPVDNDAFAFEVTAGLAEVGARYVIGLAAFVSGDFLYSEALLLSVEERIGQPGMKRSILKGVAKNLPTRFESLYSAWLNVLHREYYLRRDPKTVERAEAIADKLLARRSDHYMGLLWKSICHFILRRDVRGAHKVLLRCRRFVDPTWRYSRAFLFAYDGQLSRAREAYRDAFRAKLADRTVPLQADEFIQIILDGNPERGQLHFASALINQFAKLDTKTARRDYEAFLAHQVAPLFPDEVQIARAELAQIPVDD